MAQIMETIPLMNKASATRTATAYAPIADDCYGYWNPTQFDGTVEVYFEAVMKISTTTRNAKAALYNNLGVQVASSVITTTSTAAVRVRSGNIAADANFVAGMVYMQFGISATTATATIYNARLIIKQSGTITKTETAIELGNTTNNYSGPGTSYVEHPNTGYFLYTAANWDGTRVAILEATMEDDGAGTVAYAMLYDTLGNAVSGSEVQSTGDGVRTVIRGSDFFSNLVDGRTYLIRIKETGTSTNSQVLSARVIMKQTSFTKTETYYHLRTCIHTITTTAGANLFGTYYYDNDEWSVVSKAVYHECTLKVSDAAKTANCDLNDGTNDDDTRSTSSTAKVLLRSAGLTLDDNTNYDTQIRITATTATATLYGSHIVIVIVMTSSGTAYSFAATVAAFTLTGIAELFYRGRMMSATKATFTLTMKNAILAFNRKLTAIVGSFALTMKTAIITSARKITASVGAFVQTMKTVNLKRGWALGATATGYTLTMINAILTYGKKLTAIVGAFTQTRINAIITSQRRISAAVGSFTLTGINILLKRGFRLVESVTAFTLTGIATGLSHGKYLIAISSGFTLTGINAVLHYGRGFLTNVASFTLTGYSTGFSVGRRLAASVAPFTLTGRNVILAFGKRLTATVANFALTGRDVLLTLIVYAGPLTYTLAATVGTFTLTTVSAALHYGKTMAATTQTYALTGINILFHRGINLTAVVARFTLTPIPLLKIFWKIKSIFTNLYSSRGSSFGDKYSARGTSEANKYSARGTIGSDKYSNRGTSNSNKYSNRGGDSTNKYV